jgi:uncharacterized protein (TIGR02246 family)
MLRAAGLAIVGLMALALPATAEDVRQAVEQANARFVQAFDAGNAAAVAALYTEDARLLPPDATDIGGRAAIQKFWQGFIDDGLKDLTLQTTDVETSGDLAYEIGNFSVQEPADDSGMTTITGNYLVVWKRGTDGQWRLHVDTWNEAPAD